jgi:hypothetical protein
MVNLKKTVIFYALGATSTLYVNINGMCRARHCDCGDLPDGAAAAAAEPPLRCFGGGRGAHEGQPAPRARAPHRARGGGRLLRRTQGNHATLTHHMHHVHHIHHIHHIHQIHHNHHIHQIHQNHIHHIPFWWTHPSGSTIEQRETKEKAPSLMS